MKKALIAMSGGVDSSVAAYLMIENGYDCIGANMRLFQNEDAGISKENTCCSLDDVEDARAVARRLDMPFYVFNFTEDFRTQVMERFARAYEAGATPNPCIDCNRYLKFERFYQRAKELDCDCAVTGHYARIVEENGRFFLKKALDESKDQSYVLYSMTQDQLAHTRLPLGELRKTQVRELAEQQGFVNARKHDSQDICFVPDGDYAAAIGRITGKAYPQGEFVDMEGHVLGTHKGIIHYTIGQRKGLGLALPQPLFVCKKDLEHNQVILGKNDALFTKELDAYDFNWSVYDTPPQTLRAKAKIRYRQAEQWAQVTVTGKDTVHVEFEEPQRAITSGQAVVLYDGDTVLGGGTIA